MYDIIIIGRGPAGLSSAIYTSRANLKTLVIGESSVIEKTEKIDNYLGFSSTISGKQLISDSISQAKRFGVEVLEDKVIAIVSSNRDSNKIFTIKTTLYEYQAKAVLIASGAKRNIVNIKNVKEFEGSGVSYCTTCDGFFFKNKKVGVLGNTDYTLHEAEELLMFTDNVVILTNGEELNILGKDIEIYKSDRIDSMNEIVEYKDKNGNNINFKLNKNKIDSLKGDLMGLTGIVFENGIEANIDGLFIALKTPGTTEFAQKLGIETKNNKIVVDSNCMTNIKGIFAAGDCVNEFMQISTAVGSGAFAGKSIIDYVRAL